MDFHEWIRLGVDSGWCGPVLCYTHDGLPTSQEEDEEFSEGDPCIHIARFYDSPELKAAVEDNHSPSVWRKNG